MVIFINLLSKKGEVMKKSRLMLFLFLVIGSQVIFASQVQRAQNLIRQRKNIVTGNKRRIVDFLSDDQLMLLTQTVDEAKKKIDDAHSVMSSAQAPFLAGDITADEFENRIYEQSAIIAFEEQNLKKIIDEEIYASNLSQAPQDYLSQLRRSFMAWS
jgi:hypothetical protein